MYARNYVARKTSIHTRITCTAQTALQKPAVTSFEAERMSAFAWSIAAALRAVVVSHQQAYLRARWLAASLEPTGRQSGGPKTRKAGLLVRDSQNRVPQPSNSL